MDFAVVASFDVEAGVVVVIGFEDVTGFVVVACRFRLLRFASIVIVVVIVAVSVSVKVT